MLEDFCITLIKTLFFNICSSYVFIKIQKLNNINKNVKCLIILLNIIIAIIYAIIYEKIEKQSINTFSNLGCYIIYILIFSIMTKVEYRKMIIFSIISISFSFLSIIISSIVAFAIMSTLSLNVLENNLLEYVFIGIMQITLIYAFFEIRRFKNRFCLFDK